MIHANPYAIHDARHNLVELLKELALVEGHLDDWERQCPLCITKHLHTIMGLAEEGATLDQASPDLVTLFEQVRDAAYAAQNDGRVTRQTLRTVRRALVEHLVKLQGGPAVLQHLTRSPRCGSGSCW
jgi:hypothetical protein